MGLEVKRPRSAPRDLYWVAVTYPPNVPSRHAGGSRRFTQPDRARAYAIDVRARGGDAEIYIAHLEWEKVDWT